MRRRTVSIVLAALTAGQVQAQIVLPGAAPPTPVGTTERPPPPPRPRRPSGGGFGVGGEATPLPKGAPIAVPSVLGLTGKPLLLNGATSEIVFAPKAGGAPPPSAKGKPSEVAADADIVVTRLAMTGELISKPGDPCRINVKPSPSIETKSLGRPAGVVRLQLELASCPFSFDVLDGAILPTKDTQTCVFKSADCQVSLAGMWGPKGSDITPAQIKDLERSRATADRATREAFRDLLKRTKAKPEIKKVAAEQAAFSSLREEICRSYALESVHGFCATRLTEARVTALRTLVEAAPPPPPKKGRAKAARE